MDAQSDASVSERARLLAAALEPVADVMGG
jgi:hypothetical protein